MVSEAVGLILKGLENVHGVLHPVEASNSKG